MPRIFASLVVANLVCLLGTGALGFISARLGETRHVVLAVFTILLGCFLQVLVFTYFTIAGKLVAQAVHLGQMDTSPLEACKRLKKRLTRLLAGSALSLVLVTATGASAWRGGQFSWPHFLSAAAVVAVHVGVWIGQYTLVVQQAALLETILRQYREKKGDISSQSGIL